MTVSLSSPKWGLEGEDFNATLVFENVTDVTSIGLTPNWDRLNVSKTEIMVDKDEEIKLSPDFLFLLNLLVLGSGIAPAITAMTVLEPVRYLFSY